VSMTQFTGGARGADDHCFVDCECGGSLSSGADYIHRCPTCGQGYRTEFKIVQYESGETDPQYEEWSTLIQRVNAYNVSIGHPEWMRDH